MKIISYNRELVSRRLAASAVLKKVAGLSPVRMVLVADDLNGPLNPGDSLDFLFFARTENSNEIRDKLSFDDSGKFRHDGKSLKLIGNPDEPNAASVAVSLYCGNNLSCDVPHIPCLSTRGNHHVHLASIADCTTFKIVRIGQAAEADKQSLVENLVDWIGDNNLNQPVPLTPSQVNVARYYVPDLIEHGTDVHIQTLSLFLPQILSQAGE